MNLFDEMRMAAAQIDVHRVLVIDDATDARHGRVDQLLLLHQRPLLQLVRQRARIESTHAAPRERAHAPADLSRLVAVQVTANKLLVLANGDWILPFWRERALLGFGPACR